MSRLRSLALAGALALTGAHLYAEPTFISRQYTRCTTCHYSPTGGGLLTPYGRSLSRQELSTTGRSASGQAGKEETFLYGALGNALGPVQLGFDTRPAHLNFNFDGTSTTRDLFMNADLLAAYRVQDWTFYGEVGRQVRPEGSKIDSYEYWVAHQPEKGIGFRVGRFLPAYGVHLADHTAFTRAPLGFDSYDQLYALELSRAGDRSLLQLTLSPGRADSILKDDGRKAFTATGRYQWDFGPRMTLVASGLYRDQSKVDPRSGGGGLAFGIAPTSRLSIWNEADAKFESGTSGPPAYILMNETGFEVYRGVWLSVSPQLRTEVGSASGGVWRLAFAANLLPRTHWNVEMSYYHDRSRLNDLVTKTFLAQLHLYL